MKYQGTVVKVTDSTLSIAVAVEGDACSACHVKSACEVGRNEDKILIVNEPNAQLYELGKTVWVEGKSKSELKAVMLAYVVPFLLLFITLGITRVCTHNDGVSGAVALGVLALYYIILYFFRKRMEGAFAFSIIKNETE